MKLFTKAAAAVSTAVLVGSLAACGGSDRPSQDEISDSLTSEDSVIPVPEAAADCVAKVFHESDLSNETLQAMVDQDEDYEAPKEDEEALEGVQSAMVDECSDAMAE